MNCRTVYHPLWVQLWKLSPPCIVSWHRFPLQRRVERSFWLPQLDSWGLLFSHFATNTNSASRCTPRINLSYCTGMTLDEMPSGSSDAFVPAATYSSVQGDTSGRSPSLVDIIIKVEFKNMLLILVKLKLCFYFNKIRITTWWVTL